MISNLRDKSITVMVVEPIQSIRRLMASIIKDLGFSNIESYESLNDAKKSIFRLGPKWVITSLCERDSFNAITLLNAALKEDVLSDCMISLLVDAANQDILPDAFQLGLISSHPQVTTAGTLKNELTQLFSVCESCKWNLSAVAAHYLFSLLATRKEFKDLTSTLNNCLTLFPDHLFLTLKHAEAFFMQGKNDQAIMVLRHAKTISSDHKNAAEKLCQNYLGATLTTIEGQQSFAASQGMRTAVIIDSDQTTVKALTAIFQDLGFVEIAGFSDALTFFDWLRDHPDVDLIVSEWKIPKGSGPAIIQRIRVDHALSAPLIIHSSVVQDKDRVLLKELGVTDVIPKPMYQKILGQELKTIIAADIEGTKAEVLVNNIRSAIRKKELSSAQTSLDRLKAGDAPGHLKQHLEAEVLLAIGDAVNAKNIAVSALNTGGESLALLDLLGRILLKLRELDLAKKFLDKAAKISPENIERLCLQAEVATELGDKLAAEASFAKAEKIDGESTVLLETKATIATVDGQEDLVKSLIKRLSSGEGVVGRLNNRAVSLVKDGKPSEALALYKQALSAVAGDDPDLGGVLLYNIALSHIRAGNTRAAAESLASIKDPKKTRVGAKVTSLSQRVITSLKSGKPLVTAADELPELEPVAAPFIPIYPKVRPGTRALYLIYQRDRPFLEKTTVLLNKS